jgi:hypothetical protein
MKLHLKSRTEAVVYALRRADKIHVGKAVSARRRFGPLGPAELDCC